MTNCGFARAHQPGSGNSAYDGLGQEVEVRKEGIHFDLAHMNRIEWDPVDLDDFRVRLENRIKAVIV